MKTYGNYLGILYTVFTVFVNTAVFSTKTFQLIKGGEADYSIYSANFDKNSEYNQLSPSEYYECFYSNNELRKFPLNYSSDFKTWQLQLERYCTSMFMSWEYFERILQIDKFKSNVQELKTCLGYINNDEEGKSYSNNDEEEKSSSNNGEEKENCTLYENLQDCVRRVITRVENDEIIKGYQRKANACINKAVEDEEDKKKFDKCFSEFQSASSEFVLKKEETTSQTTVKEDETVGLKNFIILEEIFDAGLDERDKDLQVYELTFNNYTDHISFESTATEKQSENCKSNMEKTTADEYQSIKIKMAWFENYLNNYKDGKTREEETLNYSKNRLEEYFATMDEQSKSDYELLTKMPTNPAYQEKFESTIPLSKEDYLSYMIRMILVNHFPLTIRLWAVEYNALYTDADEKSFVKQQVDKYTSE